MLILFDPKKQQAPPAFRPKAENEQRFMTQNKKAHYLHPGNHPHVNSAPCSHDTPYALSVRRRSSTQQRPYPFGGGPIPIVHRACQPFALRCYLAHRASIHHIIKLLLCTFNKIYYSTPFRFVNYFLRKFP